MRWSQLLAWITPRWKYIRSPVAELYDLIANPRELKTLAPRYSEQQRLLDEESTAWEEGMSQRLANNIALTEQERRVLTCLGCASHRERTGEPEKPLRDVKEMLPLYY